MPLAFLLLALAAVGNGRQGRLPTTTPAGKALPLAHRIAADASLREAVRAVQYRVEPSSRRPGTFQAASPAHRMQVQFDRKAVRLAEARPQPTWQLGLQLASIGRGRRVESLRAASVKSAGNRVEYRHRTKAGGQLTEWYVNEPQGLEQGFTLERDLLPGSGTAPLRLALSLTGDLTAQSAVDGQSVALRGETGGTVLQCDHLKAWDRTGRELPSRMSTVASAGGQALTLEIDDAAALYPVTVDPVWAQQAKLFTSDIAAGDQLGSSVAISGDYVVVGASGDDRPSLQDVGAAYVFVRSGSSWTQQAKLTDTNGAASASFGESVSIDGDIIAVGAPAVNAANPGAVCVFERSGTSWSRTARFTQTSGGLGRSVSLRGNQLVAGAPNQSAGIGRAYVYERSGGSWSQTAVLSPSTTTAQQFGSTVAMSPLGTLFVGAPAADDRGTQSGAVEYYYQSGATWNRGERISPSDGAAFAGFSYSLATDGLTMVACSQVTQSAYVYTFSTSWQLQQKLTSAVQNFGLAASVEGATLAIGAYDTSARGAVLYYTRSGSTWTQQQKLTDPNGASSDMFGHSVALSTKHVVVGSWWDDDNGTNSGTLFIFAESPPAIANVLGQETLEDLSTGPISFTVSDPDTATTSLMVSASSSVTDFVQSFTFGGTAGSRTVEIVPAANVNGSTTITLFVTDGMTTTSKSFTLTVQPVNDAPSFTAGADQDVAMDSGARIVSNWATNLQKGPANEAGQTLAFLVTGNTNPSLFSVQPAVTSAGTLTFTPAAGTAGTANVKLVLQDSGDAFNGGSNTSAETTLRITVWNNTPPHSLTATTVSENEVDLAWVDANDQETGFRIERKAPGAADFTLLTSVAANVTSYQDLTVTHLSGSYTYRVLATTPAGLTAPSNEATALVQLLPPTGLGVFSLSSTENVLYWYDNSLVETGYEVQRKLSGGTYELVAVLAAGSRSYVDAGLTPDATYFYQVRAFTAERVSSWSNEGTNGPTGTLPAAPSGLSAIQAGPNEVRLAWTDNSSDETDFELRRKTGAAGAVTSYARIATLPAGSTSYLDGGRTPGATYTYQVVAVNDAGSSDPAGPASATLTIDTVKPTLTLVGTRSGPPVQIDIAARDTGSGLAEIEVVVSDNCTISFAPFTPGTTAPVLVTATKINPALTARVVLRARDLAGNVQDGDPIITELVIGKKQTKVVKSFSGLPVAESWLRVENDTPGLKKLVVTVNQTKPLSLPLKDGQMREQDLANRMQPGDTNSMKLVGYGKPGSRALVILAEPPSAGSPAKLRIQRLAPSGPAMNLEWHR